MSGQVLTEVSAVVPTDREADLIAGFHQPATQPRPAGLLRSELLRGPDGRWRIQTLWRDAAALAAMRASPEPPAAPALFRTVGADPALVVLDVMAGLDAGSPPA